MLRRKTIIFSKLTLQFVILCMLFAKTMTQSVNDLRIKNMVENTINQELNQMITRERTASRTRQRIPRPSERFTSVYMLAHFNQEDPKVKKMRNSAYVNLMSSKRIMNQSSIPFETYANDKSIRDGFMTAFNCTEPPRIQCDRRARFRTIDGSCNNLANPRWGCHLPHKGGIDAPREKGHNGIRLKSARVVSNSVLNGDRHGTSFNSANTMMTMAWGQFIDHDLTFTPTPAEEGGEAIDCCKDKNHMDCFPIKIPRRDRHFRKTCMHFIRSSPTLENPCVPGVRNQVNQLTSFMDGSQVYGSTKNQSDSLRSFRRGQLKTASHNLPPPDLPTVCQHEPGEYCLKAGDSRINEVVHLGAMHIVFLRYHNILAARLSELNPRWTDERTFQEARRIIGALFQKITYFDYLPIIISRRDMDRYCLNPSPFCRYDPKINPSIKNSFSTAALRFGHSMVGPTEAYFNGDFRTVENETDIESTMNNPHFLLYKNGRKIPDLMRFVCTSKAARTDRILEPNVRNKLFLDKKGDSLDLGALNVQRGRDHGLPSYIKWREFCGLPKVTSQYFHNGRGGLVDHSYDSVYRLRRAYRHPADIDLYAGALSERPMPGAQVGPTFSCLLARQFQDLKLGDRFWFESNHPVTGLTWGQIRTIQRVPLSKIVCDSMKSRFIQKDIFRTIGPRNDPNQLQLCRDLPDLDLSQWRYRRNSRQYSWRPRTNSYYWV